MAVTSLLSVNEIIFYHVFFLEHHRRLCVLQVGDRRFFLRQSGLPCAAPRAVGHVEYPFDPSEPQAVLEQYVRALRNSKKVAHGCELEQVGLVAKADGLEPEPMQQNYVA